MEKTDLNRRTFEFSVNTIKFLKNIRNSKENDVVKYQLSRSASSVGANYEEAQGAYSKDDFKYKIGLCLKEARESHYWLRIVKAVGINESQILDSLIQEAMELSKIFATMLKNMRGV
ncbi:MAG TPA: four helix bundle protein [Candidatus Omnitrophota bacterium]|nr:four helix bundle protein [Candidatus Omnitrophota bacterium]HPN88585.1 four helix bundle protein [Candidatus Omnitrophota bacterium]